LGVVCDPVVLRQVATEWNDQDVTLGGLCFAPRVTNFGYISGGATHILIVSDDIEEQRGAFQLAAQTLGVVSFGIYSTVPIAKDASPLGSWTEQKGDLYLYGTPVLVTTPKFPKSPALFTLDPKSALALVSQRNGE
jgi:hypothetical protein